MEGRSLASFGIIALASFALGKTLSRFYFSQRFSLFIIIVFLRAVAWIIIVQFTAILCFLITYWLLQILQSFTWSQFEFVPQAIRELGFKIEPIELYPALIGSLLFSVFIRWKYFNSVQRQPNDITAP